MLPRLFGGVCSVDLMPHIVIGVPFAVFYKQTPVQMYVFYNREGIARKQDVVDGNGRVGITIKGHVRCVLCGWKHSFTRVVSFSARSCQANRPGLTQGDARRALDKGVRGSVMLCYSSWVMCAVVVTDVGVVTVAKHRCRCCCCCWSFFVSSCDEFRFFLDTHPGA